MVCQVVGQLHRYSSDIFKTPGIEALGKFDAVTFEPWRFAKVVAEEHSQRLISPVQTATWGSLMF
jgi:hypothetical protein